MLCTTLHQRTHFPPTQHLGSSLLQIAGKRVADSLRLTLCSSLDGITAKRRKVPAGVLRPTSPPCTHRNRLPWHHDYQFLCDTLRFSGNLMENRTTAEPHWSAQNPTLGLRALLILHQYVEFQTPSHWCRHSAWMDYGFTWGLTSPLAAAFVDLLPDYGWGSQPPYWGFLRPRLHPSPVIPWGLSHEHPVSVDSNFRVSWITPVSRL